MQHNGALLCNIAASRSASKTASFFIAGPIIFAPRFAFYSYGAMKILRAFAAVERFGPIHGTSIAML
jgi:hypothetical protein